MPFPSAPFFQKHGPWLGKLMLVLSIIVLVYLRFKTFIHGNSLMIDEANVALNLAERNFAGLWQSLDYAQYAPPLYLTVTKLSTWLFGMNEYALRLPAFISSLVSIFLIVRICRQPRIQFSPLYIAIVLILFGCSHIMLFQGDLLKQYTTDAMVGLLLILMALKYDYHFLLSRRGILLWVVLGSVAVWSSMPSVFILASIGGYYLFQSTKEQKGRTFVKHFFVPALIWGAQFIIYFFAILKTDAESNYLQDYHQEYFFKYALWEKESWMRMGKIFSGLIQAYIGKTVVVFIWVILTFLAGLLTMVKNKRALFILFVVPGLLAIGASFLHYYSFIPRLLVFYAPLFYIVLAMGVRALWKSSSRIGRALVLLSTLFVLGQMSGWHYMHPQNHCLMEETREVMDDLSIPSDGSYGVFVNHSGAPALKFYTRHFDQKGRYQPFVDFRHINWDKDIFQEARAFLNQHPERSLLIIWGHERNDRIRGKVEALGEDSVVVKQNIEKTMARAVELRVE